MARRSTEPRPLLREGAVYWADNGERICRDCAGMSAKFTGRDISGQRVARVNAAEVREWLAAGDLGPMQCERGCTRLSEVVGADGWPLATAGAA
jgi:hypothetical protein